MNSSVRVGSLGPLTLVRAGCELDRSARSFAPATLPDDMAIVAGQVAPAAASEVAA